jgi:ubiquinone/menaquinone biosynthesis C-methylase UbiE
MAPLIPRQWRQPKTPESQWFWDHYEWAANQIAEFCEQGGVSLGDSVVADVGCGDGIMALGLFNRVRPRSLVGFDIVPTNAEQLLARARNEGVADVLPDGLAFQTSTPQATPAADDTFDFVYSWSAFEHIAEPVSVLREIHRILRPTGHFFLQLWPFYHSPRGSHLWDWFDDEFHHLKTSGPDVVAAMAASNEQPLDRTQYMSREFEHLNRITLDELQRSVLAAGFDVHRLELLAAPVHLTPELARYSWTDLGIGGVKLIALPRR